MPRSAPDAQSTLPTRDSLQTSSQGVSQRTHLSGLWVSQVSPAVDIPQAQPVVKVLRAEFPTADAQPQNRRQ